MHESNVFKYLCLSTAIVVLMGGCTASSAVDRSRVAQQLAVREGLRTSAEIKPQLPPGVALADGLTEDEAVAVALWNNPAFQAELATLGIARADLLDAGMIRNPLMTLFLPWGPRQLELTATLPIEALWQRGRRVHAAELDVDRVAHGLVQTGLDLIRSVKVAYADVELADERDRLLRESLTVRRHVAEIGQARLRAGDISVLEASAVGVDAKQAEEELARQSHARVVARNALRRLLGIELPTAVALSVPAPEPRVGDVAVALKTAVAARPDVRAAELAIEAAGARLGWEKTKIVTNLSAATKGSGVGGEWVIGPGFALEIPLFNQNQGPRARAHADIERTMWQYAAVRHRVEQEVRDAFEGYASAAESRKLLRDQILPALEENLRRAEKAFRDGEVSHLFVLEATRQRIDAALREADATANLARAAAECDRSVGRKVIDAH
jgi:cobalt-zinc-cadmium efflux system outer membrane protein